MDGNAKFDGEVVAQMLEKWNNGDSLTDTQLKIAIKGMQFIVGFCGKSKLIPLAHYYATKLVGLETAFNNQHETN